MSPAIHLVLIVFALAAFAYDFGISKAVTRVTSLGLAFLVASMISW